MDELEQLAKLDQDYQTQRTALLEAAKQQWLDKINPLIAQGKALGFNYGPISEKQTPKGRKASFTTTTDSKEDREKRITDLLAKHPEGLFVSQIHEKLSATDDAAKVRINNDLQALGQGKTGSKKIKQVEATADRLLSLLDPVTGKKPLGKQPKLWVLTKQD